MKSRPKKITTSYISAFTINAKPSDPPIFDVCHVQFQCDRCGKRVLCRYSGSFQNAVIFHKKSLSTIKSPWEFRLKETLCNVCCEKEKSIQEI